MMTSEDNTLTKEGIFSEIIDSYYREYKVYILDLQDISEAFIVNALTADEAAQKSMDLADIHWKSMLDGKEYTVIFIDQNNVELLRKVVLCYTYTKFYFKTK